MEMNTRLQVEHPVTELVTGIDLVEQQLRIAAGEQLCFGQADIVLTGHAIEARLYSEDPERGFLPADGTVGTCTRQPATGIRVDSGLVEGLVVGTDYDPMLAKIIGCGADRDAALRRLDAALADTVVLGVRTNREFLQKLVADDRGSRRRTRHRADRAHPVRLCGRPFDALFAIAALARERAAAVDRLPPLPGWRIGDHRPAASEFGAGDAPARCAWASRPSPWAPRRRRRLSARDGATAACSRRRLTTRRSSSWATTPGSRRRSAIVRSRPSAAARSSSRLTAPRSRRARARPAPDIRTPMPGTVVAVRRRIGRPRRSRARFSSPSKP